VRIDSLQLRMRPRSPYEAADLGLRFGQHHWRSLHACNALAAVPVLALCVASFEIASWLPLTLIFLVKPWIDRTSLFVLSRAAFGQQTRLSDLWAARREVWWSQLVLTLTLRRLSPWRAYTQPIYQLEGLSARARRQRRLQICKGYRGPAMLVTSVFALAETLFVIGLVSLVLWLTPTDRAASGLWESIDDFSGFAATILPTLYALVVLFLEPFFVATGFAMYLNRRAELEAWDIEQELRRAFGR
jgi:hypothetical protein